MTHHESTGDHPVRYLHHPPYHPLSAVEPAIRAILGEGCAVTSTENAADLTLGRLADAGLCVCYADLWDKQVPAAATAGIVSWVCSGGALLVIHTGISLQSNPEYALLMGGRFRYHPPMRELYFTPTGEAHEIMAGIEGFSVTDEPYEFDLSPLSKRTELFAYATDAGPRPGGWAIEFGLGRVVYLMPGHDKTAFANQVYQEIIRRSARWVCGDGAPLRSFSPEVAGV